MGFYLFFIYWDSIYVFLLALTPLPYGHVIWAMWYNSFYFASHLNQLLAIQSRAILIHKF